MTGNRKTTRDRRRDVASTAAQGHPLAHSRQLRRRREAKNGPIGRTVATMIAGTFLLIMFVQETGLADFESLLDGRP